MSHQCLQPDIYMSLDFVQEFSLMENDFYNSGMMVIAFNGVYLTHNTSLITNCQLTNLSRLTNWM